MMIAQWINIHATTDAGYVVEYVPEDGESYFLEDASTELVEYLKEDPDVMVYYRDLPEDTVYFNRRMAIDNTKLGITYEDRCLKEELAEILSLMRLEQDNDLH